MSDTHVWDVEITAVQDVIGVISQNTVFYTGPYEPLSQQMLVQLYIQNTGQLGGYINWKIVEYPNDSPENTLWQDNTYANAGATVLAINFAWQIPDLPGQQWPLGVKVWGETESEPPWGTAGQTYIHPLLTP